MKKERSRIISPNQVLHPAGAAVLASHDIKLLQRPQQASSAFGGEEGRSMITPLRREFTVDRPIEKAWQHLARVEQWPSRAKRITQVEVQPHGALGPKSTGLIHLSNGVKSAFTMTEFNPYRNWKWVGGFLWLTIHYDHRFEELNPTQTKLTLVVEAKGFGVSVFGRLFAKIYSKNLDRAIPLLVETMNARRV